MITVALDHAFHAAHSLPHLPGKCSSIHGHTWRVSITIAGPHLDHDDVLVEFGAFKSLMKAWIDDRLDHSLMLGQADNLVPLLDRVPAISPHATTWEPDTTVTSPLAEAFAERGQRLFIFGRDFPDAAWPSVEAVAQLIAHHAHGWLDQATTRRDLRIATVTVRETDTNAATWHNPAPAPVPAEQAAQAARGIHDAIQARRTAAARLAATRGIHPDRARERLDEQLPTMLQQVMRDTGLAEDDARKVLTWELDRVLAAVDDTFANTLDAERGSWTNPTNPA